MRIGSVFATECIQRQGDRDSRSYFVTDWNLYAFSSTFTLFLTQRLNVGIINSPGETELGSAEVQPNKG